MVMCYNIHTLNSQKLIIESLSDNRDVLYVKVPQQYA